METLYGVGALGAVVVSLLWTWLAFFRREIVVVVTGKSTRLVRVPSVPHSKCGGLSVPRTGYFLTDAFGRELEVDEVTYNRAVVGFKLSLRQWVDGWRSPRN